MPQKQPVRESELLPDWNYKGNVRNGKRAYEYKIVELYTVIILIER